MSRIRTPMLGLALIVAVSFVLVACGGLTADNYNAVENGMTLEEVTKKLGEPKSTSGLGAGPLSAGTAIWEDGDKKVTVTLLNGKVTMKTKVGF